MEVEAWESISSFLLAITKLEVLSSNSNYCGIDLEGFGVFLYSSTTRVASLSTAVAQIFATSTQS